MGCTSSGCMTNTQSEIEIKLKSGNLTQEIASRKLEYKEPEAFVFLKEQLNPVPRIASPISLKKRAADSEEAKIQSTEDHKGYSPVINGRDSYNKMGLELNLDDLQFRYGKTMEELDFEFDSVMQNFSNARKAFLTNPITIGSNFNADEKISVLFSQWKMFVYDEICKKTGEIKNFISFGSGGRSFKIIHEVNGWKDLNLLRSFCDHAKLSIDLKFFHEMKSKIEAIGSLTVYVWIEMHDIFQEFSISIGFNLTKPSDKRLVERFLGNSIEKANIMTWFEANTPVPIEYGFGIGEEINRNEIIVGFYFFDGPLNANLGRSLTAFQAYGAELNKQMIDIFRALPGEEYKVYFIISPEGVQKVRMIINKIPEALENSILEQISKFNDLEAWRRLKKHFSSTAAKNSYFLEYSNEGFELYCITEIGGEITSRIYIEDH